MKNRFTVQARSKSFTYAFKGWRYFFTTQHNAWIQLLAATVAIVLGIFSKINSNEWCWIIFSIGFVLFAEMTNTALEFLADVVSPGHHEKVEKLKDIAAGAVLMASLTALIIGSVIFVPHLV